MHTLLLFLILALVHASEPSASFTKPIIKRKKFDVLIDSRLKNKETHKKKAEKARAEESYAKEHLTPKRVELEEERRKLCQADVLLPIVNELNALKSDSTKSTEYKLKKAVFAEMSSKCTTKRIALLFSEYEGDPLDVYTALAVFIPARLIEISSSLDLSTKYLLIGDILLDLEVLSKKAPLSDYQKAKIFSNLISPVIRAMVESKLKSFKKIRDAIFSFQRGHFVKDFYEQLFYEVVADKPSRWTNPSYIGYAVLSELLRTRLTWIDSKSFAGLLKTAAESKNALDKRFDLLFSNASSDDLKSVKIEQEELLSLETEKRKKLEDGIKMAESETWARGTQSIKS